MSDKFINVVIWVVAILLLLGVLFFIIQPIVCDYPDWVVYARVFLVLYALSTFAQLRLYNAIVQNTRFAIKLREAMLKFVQMIPTLERAMKNLNSTMGNVKASSDSVKKSIDRNIDATDELTDKLNILKFKETRK